VRIRICLTALVFLGCIQGTASATLHANFERALKHEKARSRSGCDGFPPCTGYRSHCTRVAPNNVACETKIYFGSLGTCVTRTAWKMTRQLTSRGYRYLLEPHDRKGCRVPYRIE
jgi:hypothetical protein